MVEARHLLQALVIADESLDSPAMRSWEALVAKRTCLSGLTAIVVHPGGLAYSAFGHRTLRWVQGSAPNLSLLATHCKSSGLQVQVTGSRQVPGTRDLLAGR